MAIRSEPDRPWTLDPVSATDFARRVSQLEAGLIQRARLLKLDPGGSLRPAGTAARRPYSARAGIRQSRLFGGPATVYPSWQNIFASARGGSGALADGQWWVLSDRSQAPSGAGYALENRIVLTETFPDLFREFQVERLAFVFSFVFARRCWAFHARARKPAGRDSEPGPFNETYFEQFLLARYLGFTLGAGRRS